MKYYKIITIALSAPFFTYGSIYGITQDVPNEWFGSCSSPLGVSQKQNLAPQVLTQKPTPTAGSKRRHKEIDADRDPSVSGGESVEVSSDIGDQSHPMTDNKDYPENVDHVHYMLPPVGPSPVKRPHKEKMTVAPPNGQMTIPDMFMQTNKVKNPVAQTPATKKRIEKKVPTPSQDSDDATCSITSAGEGDDRSSCASSLSLGANNPAVLAPKLVRKSRRALTPEETSVMSSPMKDVDLEEPDEPYDWLLHPHGRFEGVRENIPFLSPKVAVPSTDEPKAQDVPILEAVKRLGEAISAQIERVAAQKDFEALVEEDQENCRHEAAQEAATKYGLELMCTKHLMDTMLVNRYIDEQATDYQEREAARETWIALIEQYQKDPLERELISQTIDKLRARYPDLYVDVLAHVLRPLTR